MQWLEREHPELVEKYRFMYYGTNAYAPKDYRKWLAAKIKPLIRKHGLEQGRENPTTGGVRPTTRLSLMRNADGDLTSMSPLIAEELPPTTAARAIALF
jgi:prophage antirepressor-like protein